jgi:uncharacterized SAM-binding protein YcdF (DUF218 family)
MPEAPPPSRGDAPGRDTQGSVLLRGVSLETEGVSERELYLGSSQEDVLLPRRRRTAILAALPGLPSAAVLLACVVVLGAVASLAGWAAGGPAAQATRGGLSLLLNTEQDGKDGALSQKAVKAQAFIYMSPEDANQMVEGHMLILAPGTDLEDIHRIEKVFPTTGAVQLYHGILFSHQEDAIVRSLPPTEEILLRHDEQQTVNYVRYSKPPVSADPPGGFCITMREGCDTFEESDEIELFSEEGNFEVNMISHIVKNDTGTCVFHVIYPTGYQYDDTSLVSKMVHKDDAILLDTSTSAEDTTTTTVAAKESESGKSHGPSTAVVVSAIVVGFSVIGIVLFFLGNFTKGDYSKANVLLASRWAQNPPSAIVVPGGGLSRDGSLVPWVQERLRRAKAVYDEVNEVKAAQQVTTTTYLVTMCEGIRYSPRDPRGNRAQRLESQLSFDFLVAQGVKKSDIITDDLSLDTMGNAYFLRTTHTDVFKARSLVVITNEFHMKRTKAIFEKVFGLGPFPDGNSKYTLQFEEVKNQSIEPAALRRRVDWEDQQLKDFHRVSKDWRDLHDVHSFIFSGEGGAPKPQLRDRSPESRETSPQRP